MSATPMPTRTMSSRMVGAQPLTSARSSEPSPAMKNAPRSEAMSLVIPLRYALEIVACLIAVTGNPKRAPFLQDSSNASSVYSDGLPSIQ